MARIALCTASALLVCLTVAGTAFGATITSIGNIGGTGIQTINTTTQGTADDEPYCMGTSIAIQGSGFVTDGGVTNVTVGGGQAGWWSVGNDALLYARLGANAKTGPVVVTTPAGTVTSSATYTVLPCNNGSALKPEVDKVTPAKVKAGKKAELIGHGFFGTKTVTINGAKANYAIPSDANLYVVVPAGSKSGAKLPVVVTTSVGVAKATVTVK